MFGYSHEEFLGKKPWEIWETDHVDPEGDDEGAGGLPAARERPGAGEYH